MKRCPTCGVMSANLDLHDGERCKSPSQPAHTDERAPAAKPREGTPRTEEAHRVIATDHADPVARYRYCLDFARELERELAQSQSDLARAIANHAADLSQSATGRSAMLLEVADRLQEEYLTDKTGHEADDAYNRAVRDCINAVNNMPAPDNRKAQEGKDG